MPAWVEDSFFWGVVLVALWLALPSHVRLSMRDGMGPLVHTLAGSVREVLRAALRHLEWAAYQLVTGRPPPPYDTTGVNTSAMRHLALMSHQDDDIGSGTRAQRGSERSADDGSAAFRSAGTTRTEAGAFEPDVEVEDLRVLGDALERRGWIVLTPEEQESVRRLVYQVERRARLTPSSERSKSEAIERATGLRRGGSKLYQR